MGARGCHRAMLTFEPEGHVYRYAGRIVPGVTQTLSIVEKGFGFVDPLTLERAREFGQHVHKAVELFNDGTLDEDELDPALVPYLAQWKKFLFDTGFEVTQGEQAVYHPSLKYAGRCDILGLWKKKLWLIDLKSGGVPRSCSLQTAAYANAAPVRPQRRAALQLSGEKYNLIAYSDSADFAYYISALNVFRYINKQEF